MSGITWPSHEGPIVSVGVRVGFLGAVVMVVRREKQQTRFNDDGSAWMKKVGTIERDAHRSDLPEIAIFLKTRLAEA